VPRVSLRQLLDHAAEHSYGVLPAFNINNLERFEAFGCAGQAGRIRPEPLERIAARYRSGAALQRAA
jgi:hypothetical protein